MTKKDLFAPLNEELIDLVRQDQKNPKEIFVMLQGEPIEKEGELTEIPVVLSKLSELIAEGKSLYCMRQKEAIIPVIVTEEVYRTL